MKTIFNDNIKIVISLILGIILIMSSYLIILNIHHYESLSSKTIVSEMDNDYIKYKENVNSIEKIITKSSGDDKRIEAISKVLNNMKKDGVFRLIPKSELTYQDLYKLNDYFMEELINNGWVSNFKVLNLGSDYYNILLILVNNSNYLNSVFTNNSLSLFDDKLNNNIEDNYHFILSNYKAYSDIILSICNELGESHE